MVLKNVIVMRNLLITVRSMIKKRVLNGKLQETNFRSLDTNTLSSLMVVTITVFNFMIRIRPDLPVLTSLVTHNQSFSKDLWASYFDFPINFQMAML